LFSGNSFYLNGEKLEGVEAGDRSALRQLADQRCITAPAPDFAAQLYGWYGDGFIHLA
jgi:hypothetical protein